MTADVISLLFDAQTCQVSLCPFTPAWFSVVINVITLTCALCFLHVN